MRGLASMVVIIGVLCGAPVVASAEDVIADKPPMACNTGPVPHDYGGSSWLVYSCTDGKTLVFLSEEGSAATPFYFISYPKDGQFVLYGEGNGSKDATDAAYAQLTQMTGAERDALLAETKAVPATQPSN